jgi:large subunit ribosomal protein L29
MEIESIRNLSDEELKTQEVTVAEQIFRIRFAKSLGKQDGMKNLRVLKLDIARIKTIARERQLAASKAGK